MNILCKLGLHDWGYQAKNTGIYLHTYHDGSLPRPEDYYTNKRKCWRCNKVAEVKTNPTQGKKL